MAFPRKKIKLSFLDYTSKKIQAPQVCRGLKHPVFPQKKPIPFIGGIVHLQIESLTLITRLDWKIILSGEESSSIILVRLTGRFRAQRPPQRPVRGLANIQHKLSDVSEDAEENHRRAVDDPAN